MARLLLSNRHLKRLVETGNLIRYDNPVKTNDPFKKDVKVGDLPELVLIPSGMTMNLHSSSSSSEVFKRHTILVATGSKRINELLNAVQWEIMIAMANWKAEITPLKWNDKTFIKNASVIDVTEGLSNPEVNRGIEGWSAVWQCEVHMIFKTSELLALV
jgi:hypothetical protein